MKKTYDYEAKIQASTIGKGGAYVVFPYDLKKEFAKGRVKVIATFDGVEYSSSVVNMGLKNDDGTIFYIIGITKAIQKQIAKGIGDYVSVTITSNQDGQMPSFSIRAPVKAAAIMLQYSYQRCFIVCSQRARAKGGKSYVQAKNHQ